MFNNQLSLFQVIIFSVSVISPIHGGSKHGEWLVGGDGTMLLPGHGTQVHWPGPGRAWSHNALSDQAGQGQASVTFLSSFFLAAACVSVYFLPSTSGAGPHACHS